MTIYLMLLEVTVCDLLQHIPPALRKDRVQALRKT